jgi:hypothetical protein
MKGRNTNVPRKCVIIVAQWYHIDGRMILTTSDIVARSTHISRYSNSSRRRSMGNSNKFGFICVKILVFSNTCTLSHKGQNLLAILVLNITFIWKSSFKVLNPIAIITASRIQIANQSKNCVKCLGLHSLHPDKGKRPTLRNSKNLQINQ